MGSGLRFAILKALSLVLALNLRHQLAQFSVRTDFSLGSIVPTTDRGNTNADDFRQYLQARTHFASAQDHCFFHGNLYRTLARTAEFLRPYPATLFHGRN